VADSIRKVLNYIVTQYVVRDEMRSIDLDAPSSESGAEIESDKKEAARRQEHLADDLADAFRDGLVLAYRGRGAARAELALDDRKPEEDRIADALIRFLVSYDLAASRSEATEPRHYVYYIAVDWDRLADVARAAEVDLDRTLQQMSA
jgi:hypothetical protein